MNTNAAKPTMLVTGAGGMVGSYVREIFGDYNLLLTDQAEGVDQLGVDQLDVRDHSAVMHYVAAVRPDVVLHLAAATDVDRCEREPDWAYHANAIGTQSVALACQSHGATLVYISTAGVFWGDKHDLYTEFDPPRPANIYGASKLAGERIVECLLQRYYIVRAGWMIGGGERDKKFVGNVARLLLGGTKPLRVVSDKHGTPTYAKDLLGGVHRLIETGYHGLYHMANQGQCTRYDVALETRKLLGLSDVNIEPVSSAYFPLSAPRARSEAMRNLKLELLGLNSMRPWQQALRDYVVSELQPVLSRPALPKESA